MSIPILESNRKRKHKPNIYHFSTFSDHGDPINFTSDAFRDNVRDFLQQCAVPEDYKIHRMPVSRTLLLHEDKNFALVPLYTIEEDVKNTLNTYCDHCRYAGWSKNFLSRRRYYFVIPGDENWNKPLDDGVMDDQTHLLHGLIHCNGFGHLICVNGMEGGSKFLSGKEIMDLWDRICTNFRARKVTVQDVSRKRSMDLRLLHGVAYGHPWFGRWGYTFCRGSFGVSESNYVRAIEVLSSIELDSIVHVFRNGDESKGIKKLVQYYRDLSETGVTTVRDLLRTMLTLKSRVLPQRKLISTAASTTPASSSPPSWKASTRNSSQKPAECRKYADVAAHMDSRWPARRLEHTAQVIVDALNENKRGNKYSSNIAMTRQELRAAANKHIGDTGLLDYVMKSMNNVMVGGYIVRRAVNPSTRVLEYSIHEHNGGAKVYEPEPDAAAASDQSRLSITGTGLEPGVYNDIIYLYETVLLGYPGSKLIEIAIQAVLDSKLFVKDWPFNEQRKNPSESEEKKNKKKNKTSEPKLATAPVIMPSMADETNKKPPDNPKLSYAAAVTSAGEKTPDRSYASALMKSNGGDDEIHIERRKAVLKNGIPVITFTMDEVKKSITPLKHALIGVFGNFRPNIDDMRKIINCDWGLKSHVDISIIDQKHVLIRFNNEQDFMKVWTKENLVIKGIRFHVIQWSVDFDPTKESSKQAIWIHIPKLPANFFHEDFLASIATGVGKYIMSDNPTKTMSRVQGARVCVEVDLMKKLQKEIVVEWGPNKRVFEVIYENVPSFCKTCWKRGHKDELCKTKKIANKTEVNVDDTENIPSQKIRTSHNESTKEWVTRVFQSKGKKALWRPIWKSKRINRKERAGSSTQTYNVRRSVENDLQDQHKQIQIFKRGAVEEVGEKSFDNLLMIQNSPISQIPEKMPSPEKIQSPRKIQNQQEAQSTEKNVTSISREDRTKIPKSADQEMRKKSELTQPKIVPISEMVEATTEVSSSDSGDSVEFYDAYLLHRITDPACTFADWKKMQNENFQEVIRKKKTREKEDSISDSEYYDDENCTLADWKKVISKKNKKRLKAREKENSMLAQRDERQKRTIRKPARLID